MHTEQLQDVFDYYGLQPLYHKFEYSFKAMGLFQSIPRHMIEDFLDTYSCETFDTFSFEEFCFLFLDFKHYVQDDSS
ncbi:hypothetical protein ABEP17_00390 [Priestia flexa]|uniref:Uncharacterized protein n=1 Tax=Priestia flexa TaxID=86664 RepID=A0ABU4J9D4_9BACI|nr:hypothetical protein [Priestia flexa]MBY6087482.1 hypothetical protein [Priestia flexa]MCG7313189.1 hypothetical protein [Priestia flexa]MCP1190123.1 hypothetical protein [Priestia flexa]MDW8517611.1 hypothetical protein [Priestia flexa]MEC0666580.1 hypothetical protein [Priestia flexa]